MAQQSVELILTRHLASCLAVPVFVVDPVGELIYFNEPAERVIGRRYDEIRTMPFEEWTTAFAPSTEGEAFPVDELPLVIALRHSVPAHRDFEIVSDDGERRALEVTAFPVLGPDQRLIGAVAMFWETSRP